jgi:hypothetical protein
MEKKFWYHEMTWVGHSFLKLIIMPFHSSLSIHSKATLCNYYMENFTSGHYDNPLVSTDQKNVKGAHLAQG